MILNDIKCIMPSTITVKIPQKLLAVSINASCFYHYACVFALELDMLHMYK